jgi:transposase
MMRGDRPSWSLAPDQTPDAATCPSGFTSNQAERDVRPVKVQQRSSGGTWRTLDGLADFAIAQSYLSTARKWGIGKLDAPSQLFTTGPWLPPATAPP